MPPMKSKPKKIVGVKAAPTKMLQKRVVTKEVSDEEDDDDEDAEDHIDEDEIDEDVSLGSMDEDEDIDEDESEDMDSDDDEDNEEDEEEEEDDEDEDEEEKIVENPAKKAKLNGKEGVAKLVKKVESKKAKVEEAKKKKKEESNKTNKETANSTPDALEEQIENRASAIGPVTEEEKKMFAASFRAMSATSIFVGKLPSDTTDEDLKKLHPTVRSIRRPVSRKGLPATFGFLNFADEQTAERALKEIKKKGPVKIRGQEVLISENGKGQCHSPSMVDRRKLRIYGCPKFVTKEAIKKHLPKCVDVLLGDKEKGNAIEAVAVFRNSADAKKVLLSQPTLTLNECVCALFYLNISHNIKQHVRKKDRKQSLKQKLAQEKGKVASESDDEDDSEMPADKVIKFKKENVKPLVQSSAKKGRKRKASEPSDDDDDAPAVVALPRKSKKVSLKSPQKTPDAAKSIKKTPMRKGTPFKKAKTAA